MDVKEKLWNLLIRYGCARPIEGDENYEDNYGCEKLTSFYGSDIVYSSKRGIIALGDFLSSGVDYDKSSEVKDGSDEVFDGTFDKPLVLKYMYGDVVSGSGNTYPWIVKIDAGFGLREVLNLLSESLELKESLDSLEENLTNPYKYEYKIGSKK